MKRILFILTLIGFLSVNLFGQVIPKQISYQGVLKDANGDLVNGDQAITFKIYNEPTGGTALWTEIQVTTVTNGLFNTHLGSVTPIAGVPFDRVHFLGITIGAGAELAPRSMLTPSPYSFMSMDVMDEAITTAKIHDGAVTGDKIGSNQVVKSLNGIKNDVTLVGGTNITLTPSGNNITINAEGIGGGTVTQVNTGAGLTGGPITTTGTISVPNDGITGAMLQNNSVTSAKIVDATITGADIANNTIGPEKLNFTPGTGTIGGSGTENYIPRFTANTTLGNSAIYQSAASNIGIGTTTPAMMLDVMGDAITGTLHIRPQDNVDEGGELMLTGAGSHNWWRMDAFQNNLRFFSSSTNTNQVQIFNDGSGSAGLYVEGNVGIGTPAPTEKLHVVGSTLITSSDFINQNGSAQISLGDINNYIKTTYGGATDLVSFNDLRFLTGGSAGTEKMRITANGNVGIGTTAPSKIFHVIGGDVILNGLTIGKGPGQKDNNTVVGSDAFIYNTSGNSNTAIGNGSLSSNRTGGGNTAVGTNAGFTNESIHQGTFIGGAAWSNLDGQWNVTAIGYQARNTASYQVRIGSSNVSSIGGYAGWTNLSDVRFKVAINENVKGLDFVLKLRPVTYQLDINKLSQALNEDQRRDEDGNIVNIPLEMDVKSRNEKSQMVFTGFVAQEVEQAANEIGFDFSGIDKPKNENDFYGLRYAEFVVPLVKAIQEQQKIIEDLTKRIEALEGR